MQVNASGNPAAPKPDIQIPSSYFWTHNQRIFFNRVILSNSEDMTIAKVSHLLWPDTGRRRNLVSSGSQANINSFPL